MASLSRKRYQRKNDTTNDLIKDKKWRSQKHKWGMWESLINGLRCQNPGKAFVSEPNCTYCTMCVSPVRLSLLGMSPSPVPQSSGMTFTLKCAALILQQLQWESLTGLNSSHMTNVQLGFMKRYITVEMPQLKSTYQLRWRQLGKTISLVIDESA